MKSGVEATGLKTYGKCHFRSGEKLLKLNEADTFSAWDWREQFGVGEQDTSGYMCRFFEDEFWTIKTHVIKNDQNLRDFYYEAIARLAWVLRRVHPDSGKHVPWLGPPYGKADNDERTTLVALNVTRDCLEAFAALSGSQGIEGWAAYYTAILCEMVRCGISPPFQKIELPSDDPPWAPEDSSGGGRVNAQLRVDADIWQKFKVEAATRRLRTHELVDTQVDRYLRWYRETRDPDQRLPFLSPHAPVELTNVMLSIHPELVEGIDAILEEHTMSRSGFMASVLFLFFEEQGWIPPFDWPLIQEGIRL